MKVDGQPCVCCEDCGWTQPCSKVRVRVWVRARARARVCVWASVRVKVRVRGLGLRLGLDESGWSAVCLLRGLRVDTTLFQR